MSAFVLLAVLFVAVPFCAGVLGGVCAVWVLIRWLEVEA